MDPGDDDVGLAVVLFGAVDEVVVACREPDAQPSTAAASPAAANARNWRRSSLPRPLVTARS
ncbi:MAG: hypothetical protein M3070_05855 [Actinomycetota bacterium]|nr:hypothetical protein [Actinomycetota bacterium]